MGPDLGPAPTLRTMKQTVVNLGVRMKKQVFIASAVVLCSIAFGVVDGSAQQIFNQFRQPELVVNRPYRDIDFCNTSRANKTILTPTAFVLPPTNVNDVDDGYAYVAFPTGFQFRFNGNLYNGIYVSINGFATFDNTKLVPAKQSIGLFTNSASYPDNAVAPFWGDHRYRTNLDVLQGYMPSEISVVVDVDRDENCDTVMYSRVNPTTGQTEMFARRCFIIQWKNLNINDQSVNSSVGNFQARLYEATAAENFQGDIEFAYGQVGGNPNTSNTVVVTRGATVGIKGNSGFPGFLSDFWNGLVWTPQVGSNSRTDSTSIWQPSGGRSDAIIRFSSIRYLTFNNWGFGDADTSGAEGQRHAGLPQNRRVTANDARVIIQSIVLKRPLDSVWKRQAYQGDVNHSGRYYFTKLNRTFTGDSIEPLVNPNPPHIVIWRRTIDVEQKFEYPYAPQFNVGVTQTTGKQVLRVLNESEGLYGVGGRAPDVSSLNQIYYEVTEYDAGLIMRYLSGRLPELPWVYDNDTTGPDFGKVVVDGKANNVSFGSPVAVSGDVVRIPVYVNGTINGAFGAKLETSNIEGIVPVNSELGEVTVDASNDVAVVIGAGSFDANSPVAYVTVKAADAYRFSGIRFNEELKDDQTVAGDVTTDAAAAISSAPNPMTTSTTVDVNVPAQGMYTVRVFDMYGKLVSTIFNGVVTGNNLTTTWNGTDLNGSSVAAGAYVVRVEGESFSTSSMVTVIR